MTEIVIKWMASWTYSNDIIVAELGFRRTEKLLIREMNNENAQIVSDYCRRFSHDDRRLHNTREEALNYLMTKEEKNIADAEADIVESQKKIRKIIKERGYKS